MFEFFLSIIIMAAGIILLWIGILKRSVLKNAFLIGLVLSSVGMIMFIQACIFQVDEGEALVKTAFKKISGTLTEPGINFKWPWEEVQSYPTRLESYSDEIPARSLDGMSIVIDLTIHYKVDKEQVALIYKGIAKNLKDLQEKIIYPILRKTIRDSIATLGAKEVYSKRSALNDKIIEDAKVELNTKYIVIDTILLRDIRLPQEVEKEIQKKIQAQQQAEAMEYKKNVAEREAEIKAIEAQGIAEAQKIINRTLTPLYLQHEAIQAYKQLAESSNSTFILMPTSPNGTGMPIILNAK